MKFVLEGNAKIGSNAASLSRPVGDTCPSSCTMLGNGCYAETTEKLRPNVRGSTMANLVSDRNRLRAFLLHAAMAGKDVRFHVSGDFMKSGKLDLAYLSDLRWACESITSRGGELPKMWVYSHVLRREVAALADLGIAVYASIHTAADLRKAKQAGFKLFALADLSGGLVAPAPRGGANYAKRSSDWRASLPRWVELAGERFLVCPEQRRGRGVVSCSGGLDSLACKWCVNGRGNVAFGAH